MDVTNDTGGPLFFDRDAVDRCAFNQSGLNVQANFPEGIAINVGHLNFSQGLEYR